MLTSELRVPVTQGLLLGGSEVRKVVIIVLQCFLIQAESSKAPGRVSSGEDPIRSLLKHKTKSKTSSLLDGQSSLWLIHRKRLPYPAAQKAPFCSIEFHLETLSDIWCSLYHMVATEGPAVLKLSQISVLYTHHHPFPVIFKQLMRKPRMIIS